MPAFPVSVPYELYDAVADALGEEWADSYLYGAIAETQSVLPRTLTAWERMRDTSAFLAILAKQGRELLKPPRFNGTPAVVELGIEPSTKRRRAA